MMTTGGFALRKTAIGKKLSKEVGYTTGPGIRFSLMIISRPAEVGKIVQTRAI